MRYRGWRDQPRSAGTVAVRHHRACHSRRGREAWAGTHRCRAWGASRRPISWSLRARDSQLDDCLGSSWCTGCGTECGNGAVQSSIRRWARTNVRTSRGMSLTELAVARLLQSMIAVRWGDRCGTPPDVPSSARRRQVRLDLTEASAERGRVRGCAIGARSALADIQRQPAAQILARPLVPPQSKRDSPGLL
jgi:hypothetical protein